MTTTAKSAETRRTRRGATMETRRDVGEGHQKGQRSPTASSSIRHVSVLRESVGPVGRTDRLFRSSLAHSPPPPPPPPTALTTTRHKRPLYQQRLVQLSSDGRPAAVRRSDRPVGLSLCPSLGGFVQPTDERSAPWLVSLSRSLHKPLLLPGRQASQRRSVRRTDERKACLSAGGDDGVVGNPEKKKLRRFPSRCSTTRRRHRAPPSSNSSFIFIILVVDLCVPTSVLL